MNTSSFVLSVSLAAVVAASARAQVSLDWSKMHATPGLDSAHAVETDALGNVYVAGYQNVNSTYTQGSAFVAAWNASGVPLWSVTYNSPIGGMEWANEIAFDGAGGLYVVGGARGASALEYATFLLRIDAAGVLTWSVEQPITANAGAGAWQPALIVDAQGRAIVGDRGPSGNGDLEITCYRSTGAVAWQTTYAGVEGGVDRVVDLALAPNGDIVAVGTVNAPTGTAVAPSPILMRLASDGTLLQADEIIHHDIPHGYGVDVEVDAQGRIVVAASSILGSWGAPWLVVIGFDAQGILTWARKIESPDTIFSGVAWSIDLKFDVFGRAVVLGATRQGYEGYTLVIVAYEPDGTEAWRSIFNDVLGTTNTEIWNTGTELVLDPSGEATAVGNYAPSVIVDPFVQCDAFMLAVDATGQKRFGFKYGFPGTGQSSLDYGYAAASGSGPTIVLAGQAQTGAGATGYDAYVTQFTRTAVGFCYGDGVATACPCGNASADVERAGCASSLGVGGRIADSGASSLAQDTLTLVGSSMPNTPTTYFQGMLGQAGAPFGDGLLCASGTIIRLGTTVNVAGGSHYPATGGLPVSVWGQLSAPGTRVYQAMYRDTAQFCTAGLFNSTNGLRVTWTP